MYLTDSGFRKVSYGTLHLCKVKYCSLRIILSTQYFYQAHKCNFNLAQVDSMQFLQKQQLNLSNVKTIRLHEVL